MASATVEHTSGAIRQQILAAAEIRFRHYGYNKTTMSEIAADTGMSAANIYRYFQNKQDIVHECANRYMQDRVEKLRRTTENSNRSAGEQLLEYVLATLHFSQNLASENPRIRELVETITDQRKDLIHNRVDAEIRLIEKILQHGNDTGEFAVTDMAVTARAVHASLIIFEVPIFMSLYSLEEFELLAQSTVETLIHGLQPKHDDRN